MTKFNSCHLTFCFLLYSCGKEIKSKIFGIEAIVCFWNINKKKIVTHLSKNIPISIAILHFQAKSNKNLNNSTNI